MGAVVVVVSAGADVVEVTDVLVVVDGGRRQAISPCDRQAARSVCRQVFRFWPAVAQERIAPRHSRRQSLRSENAPAAAGVTASSTASTSIAPSAPLTPFLRMMPTLE